MIPIFPALLGGERQQKTDAFSCVCFILPSIISPAPLGYVYRTFLGGMSSEALNPEPVTELPLTPPAEEEEEDAAIALENFNNTHRKCML